MLIQLAQKLAGRTSHLSDEPSFLTVSAVYIPMDANVNIALSQLLAIVINSRPGGVLFHNCKTFLTCLDLFSTLTL